MIVVVRGKEYQVEKETPEGEPACGDCPLCDEPGYDYGVTPVVIGGVSGLIHACVTHYAEVAIDYIESAND